jgi:hypothetical protein
MASRKSAQARVNGTPIGSIVKRQNSPEAIELLAAQRQLYIEAKRLRRVRLWVAWTMACIGVAVTAAVPDMLKIIAPIGAALLVAQWLASNAEKQRTKAAANVQEQFDTSVYGLAWNTTLGKKVEVEGVIAAAMRFKGERQKLVNWYCLPADIPDRLGILLCQRTNLRWDMALRRRYSDAILAVLVLLLAATVVAGGVRGISIWDYMLGFLPLVGAVVLGIDTLRSHRQHCSAQAELKAKVEAAWEAARANPRAVQMQQVREIQNGIYHLRVTAPPVPEWFYSRTRQRFEAEALQSVERLWEEAQRVKR